MLRKPVTWPAWCGLVLLLVAVPGCGLPPALPSVRAGVLDALVCYEAERDDRMPPDLEEARIGALGSRAEARYTIRPRLSQLAAAPIKVSLRRDDGRWTVVEEREDRPWWWRILNYTVGVK